MKKIQFLGAAGDVTGSSYLLTGNDNTQVLVDFGMFQGPKEMADLNYEPLKFSPRNLKGVILTHAHLDHCGRLPLLVFNGFFGKIYMTAPTFALASVVLFDAAKVAQEKLDREPLYTPDEVEKTLAMVEVVEYGQEFQIGGFRAKLRDAGHILGSAIIELVDSADYKKIVFSGDLGNSPEDIVMPTEYIDKADFVVMESTYGDKVHPKEDTKQILGEEINQVEKTSGVLLVPAFSLERTQEILHRIHHLKKDGTVRADIPIFMDGPMGIRATAIFKEFREFYNNELKSHTDDPFSFEGLVVTEDERDSREIIKAMNPKVIVAGSGMMSGGRIIKHAINYLNRDTTRILFVGFQAEETLGRKILDGVKNIWLREKHIHIRAKIRNIESLSSHADQPKLLTWLKHTKNVKKVFLTHGETDQRIALSKKIKQELGINDIILPKLYEEFSLE